MDLNNQNLIASVLLVSSILIILNGMQISAITDSLKTTPSGMASFSDVDINQITSTASAIAYLYPELSTAQSADDVLTIMMPTGTPEYSDSLGGISFDNPVESMEYLAKWYYSFKDEVKNNDPEVWQRYLNLAAAPRGISCEFCCGVGPQAITKTGESKCGCQHNPALQVLTMALMKYTDYSDAQVLKEVMKWKTLFFPKNMVELGMQLASV